MKYEDGRWMCQLCFEGFTLEELADSDEPGFKTDVCKACDEHDKEMVRRCDNS